MVMVDKSPRLLWGAVAFAIYFLLIGLLVYYFNTRKSDEPKHYVKKDEKRIQVALSAPHIKKVVKTKQKKTIQPKIKPKSKLKKKSPAKKETKKKIIKEKIVKKILKKKKDENSTKPKLKKVKKQKTVDLFSNVKTKKKKIDIKISDTPVKKKVQKNFIQVTDAPASALAKINQSLKDQKSMDSGVENAYFAKVQSMLEAWPARSEFLGEEATVTLFIKPTGKFEYQVTSGSNNEAFGESVIGFLNQLQGIGFGRHNAGRTYEFEVEFSTKE